MNSIKSIYVNGLARIKVKGGEGECFKINNGVRQGCIMSPWFFNVYMDVAIKEVKMGMGRRGENGDCLVSCMQMQVSWRKT